MTAPDPGFNLELSRRRLIVAAGIAAGAMVTAPLFGTGDAEAAPLSPPSPDPVATPPVAGVHLQFGADASSEMVVSWHTLQPVRTPRVVLGRLDGKLERRQRRAIPGPADHHILRPIVHARQVPQEISDIGADAEVMKLAGVDADPHGHIIQFGYLVIWLSGHLI